jgi:P2-related tail formation protein
MKESRPVRMLPTLHSGFHVSGWTDSKESERERP